METIREKDEYIEQLRQGLEDMAERFRLDLEE